MTTSMDGEFRTKVTVSSLDTTASAKAWRWFTAFHKETCYRLCRPGGPDRTHRRLYSTNYLRSWRASNNCSNSFERRAFRHGISVQSSNGYFESSIFQQKLFGESILSVCSGTKSWSSTSIDSTATLEAKTILQTS